MYVLFQCTLLTYPRGALLACPRAHALAALVRAFVVLPLVGALHLCNTQCRRICFSEG